MFARTALTGLLVAAVAAILPAAAMATIAPTLAITQGNGTTAGSSPATGSTITFTQDGDAPKAIVDHLPAGLPAEPRPERRQMPRLDARRARPACSATSHSPTADGEQTTADAVPGDAADDRRRGRDRARTTARTTLRPAPVTLLDHPRGELKVEFPRFHDRSRRPNNGGIIAAEVKLAEPTDAHRLRRAAFFDLSRDHVSTPRHRRIRKRAAGSDRLQHAAVRPDRSRPPSPRCTRRRRRDVAITLTQPNAAGESATSGIEFGNPNGVKINKVLAPCFKGATCTVGTVAASSPTLSSTALSTGVLTLAGSINSGNLQLADHRRGDDVVPAAVPVLGRRPDQHERTHDHVPEPARHPVQLDHLHVPGRARRAGVRDRIAKNRRRSARRSPPRTAARR